MAAHLDNLYSNMKGMVIEKTRDIELLQTTTMAIAESDDLYSALVIVLRNVCDTTGWDYGEAWLPSPDGKHLKHSQAWYSSLADMEEFTNQSKNSPFRLELAFREVYGLQKNRNGGGVLTRIQVSFAHNLLINMA